LITKLEPEDHVLEDGPLEKLNRMKSCGRPIHLVEIRIVDDNGKDLPINEAGEILIRTPHPMKGYWMREEETRKSFIKAEDGGKDWLKTGDWGYLDQDNYLYIIDRIKDIIKVEHALFVSPTDIERVLMTHPDVADVAVIGVPAPEGIDEAIKACIVRKKDRPIKLTDDQFKQWCRDGRLAKYEIPRFIEFLEEIPRSDNFKVLKRVLREQHSLPDSSFK